MKINYKMGFILDPSAKGFGERMEIKECNGFQINVLETICVDPTHSIIDSRAFGVGP